jgi:hypothetical protein
MAGSGESYGGGGAGVVGKLKLTFQERFLDRPHQEEGANNHHHIFVGACLAGTRHRPAGLWLDDQPPGMKPRRR